ncbi:hypothetical protein PanWU01x14_236920 [Parasponia andersonii]|uniref:Uncharacterized protein n=1 Tax=Parasponia andersonii TaxID=3476 RepID=A0A2P5BIA0_PARAD|nr:hypothetical protein PanWU01x14_236920 [Parasponia andersonii]
MDSRDVLSTLMEKFNYANTTFGKAMVIITTIKLAEQLNRHDIVTESDSKVIVELPKDESCNHFTVEIKEPFKIVSEK